MNSLKKGEVVLLLNFEGDSGSRVTGLRSPRSWHIGPTLTPCHSLTLLYVFILHSLVNIHNLYFSAKRVKTWKCYGETSKVKSKTRKGNYIRFFYIYFGTWSFLPFAVQYKAIVYILVSADVHVNACIKKNSQNFVHEANCKYLPDVTFLFFSFFTEWCHWLPYEHWQ